ncbi:Predicted unusual protein kinase regulating ubiquinone biosynthesis, AarF/ABC1/UbiB family [Prosthecobacter debontii]|uniref:Predicted unusual protein kinase regulating ubiquinone biosynthesis, AarF/ABC1/UbiB family n=2 Tax=Prosthecobacter debontii TaxID=48467 RepID=A0A1T4WZ57_9BACT|nr:Predicted unusual protein kinase regulating ubiquinone biosynthesis, AarF/ABC1/UbiB family [Prosthecobacter debontii]
MPEPILMILSLNPEHLKRYKQVIALMIKHGHGDLVKSAPIVDDPLDFAPPPPVPPGAKELAKDLEALGPTFIKLGQLLSTRGDFVPLSYMEALSMLQDDIQPFAFEKVEAIVNVEIGARLSKAFRSFEPVPMAAASLGQVHYAVLRSGQEVAVKIQRPDVREQVAADLEAISEIAEFLDKHTEVGKRFEFTKIVNELRKAMLRELDYRLEAQTMRLMREKLSEFHRLVIPAPVDDYSTGRVLTMEYIDGTKITKLHPIVRLEVDGTALAEEVFRSYLHQILIVGVFHADPHPGNVFLTADNSKVALLDFGMVARIGPQMQDQLLKLLLAISEGQSDRAAEVAQGMGVEKEHFDEITFRREISELVSQQQGATVRELQVGKIVMNVTQVAARTGLSLPEELTMLGKTLLNLDLVGRTLDPHFDPNESIRRNASQLMEAKTLKSLSLGNLLNSLLDAKELIEKLPSRLNQFLEVVAGNKLKIHLDTIDEKVVMTGLQKVANRITLGLILASLIVGASMLMRVETSFRLFGYPGFAMLLFLLACGGGISLAWQIMKGDMKS